MNKYESLDLDQQLIYIKMVQDNIRSLYPARELSIVSTKLDEARLWLEEYRRNNE